MSNEDFARNPKTPPEALAMLSTSPSAEVRRLVALNPSTPVAALRFLAADESRAVRDAVSTNPLTPYDAFAAKEAPPAPVAEPMPRTDPAEPLTGDDFITEDDSDGKGAAPSGLPQPAQFQPAQFQAAQSQPAQSQPAGAAPPRLPARPAPATWWRRLLALLGLRKG